MFQSALLETNILRRMEQPGSALHLAIVRLTFGAYLLWMWTSPFMHVLMDIDHSLPFNRWEESTGTVFPRWLEFFVEEYVDEIRLVAIVSSIGFAIGLRPRTFATIQLGAALLLFNSYLRLTRSHVEWPYWIFLILVFCFACSSDSLSVDRLLGFSKQAKDQQEYRWPIECCILWFSCIYVSAGIAKMLPLQAGFEWLSGDKVRQVAAIYYFDSPIHWMFGQSLVNMNSKWPFVLMAIGTIVIELGAAMFLLTSRFNRILLTSIMGFHVSIYLVSGCGDFVFTVIACSVLFVSGNWFSSEAADRLELGK